MTADATANSPMNASTQATTTPIVVPTERGLTTFDPGAWGYCRTGGKSGTGGSLGPDVMAAPSSLRRSAVEELSSSEDRGGRVELLILRGPSLRSVVEGDLGT